MGKNILKRGLIIGIVCMFLSTTYIPVSANEGKPDLIVSKIYRDRIPDTPNFCIYAVIKNIGTETAIGTFYLHDEIRKLFFGSITHSETHILGINELKPGAVYEYFLGTEWDLIPYFYFFIKLSCTVNPEKTIEESNYCNNNRARIFFYPFLNSPFP